jgi:hypothetical protein
MNEKTTDSSVYFRIAHHILLQNKDHIKNKAFSKLSFQFTEASLDGTRNGVSGKGFVNIFLDPLYKGFFSGDGFTVTAHEYDGQPSYLEDLRGQC